jgi:hypothetical protein
MKHVALVLLVVGIGLTAAFGARNPADIDNRTAANTLAAGAEGATAEAKSAFCEAYLEAELAPIALCAEVAAEGTSSESDDGADAEAQTLAPLNAASLTGDLVGLHTTWEAAQQTSVTARHEAMLLEPPASGKRFGDWFDLAGLPFLLGLALLVTGAILSRVVAKKEATSGESESTGPQDFGLALNNVGTRIHSLADEIARADALDEREMVALQEQIQSIQLEGFEPLIDARLRVQARFGLAGYAAIFGPLSSSERFLNRAWSALVDSHVPEATASLRHSAEEITVAISQVEAASKAG